MTQEIKNYRYIGFENIADVFNNILKICDNKEYDKIIPLFNEMMKIMALLHTKLLKLLNKECTNCFEAEIINENGEN